MHTLFDIHRVEVIDIELIEQLLNEHLYDDALKFKDGLFENYIDILDKQRPIPDVFSHMWVARDKNRCIGMSAIRSHMKHKMLVVFVNPDYRSKGIGRQLCSFAKEEFNDLYGIHTYSSQRLFSSLNIADLSTQ